MLRFHTLVLSSDNSIKQGLRRLGVAISSHMEFVDGPAALAERPAGPLDLVIIDQRQSGGFSGVGQSGGAVQQSGGAAFFETLPPLTRLIYLVDDNQLVTRLDLFQRERTASILCCRGALDEEELIATATKLLRGELFGLQKYLPWGVTTFTVEVHSYEEKDRALHVMTESAALAGWRGPLRERIQLVCDELMMNALYHAPVDATGKRRNEGRNIKDLVGQDLAPIQAQYGSSGRYFGIAVRDGFGSLSREQLLTYLLKARTVPAEVEDKASGAGLGLVMVLRSASKLIFNLAPGNATEVIALFDRELLSKGHVGARALAVFTAPVIARASAPEPRASGESQKLGRLAESGVSGSRGAQSALSTRSGQHPSSITGPTAPGGPATGAGPSLEPPSLDGEPGSRGWLLPMLVLAALLSGLLVYKAMTGGRHPASEAPPPTATAAPPTTEAPAPDKPAALEPAPAKPTDKPADKPAPRLIGPEAPAAKPATPPTP